MWIFLGLIPDIKQILHFLDLMKCHKKLELRVHSHPNDKEEFVTKSNLELCSFDLTKHSHYEDIQLIAKRNLLFRNNFNFLIFVKSFEYFLTNII